MPCGQPFLPGVESLFALGDDTDLEEEDEVEDNDVPATPATSAVALNGSTPAGPTTDTSASRQGTNSDAIIQHLNRVGVASFRNNQDHYRSVASEAVDPAARASVSRPVRSGKSAEALITPLRKRSRSHRVAKSPLKHSMSMNQSSPLSGVSRAATRLQSSVMDSPRGPPQMGTFS